MNPGTKPVCLSCGSDQISCDATSRWDEDTQNWELSGVFDSKTCDDCGYEKDYCDWIALPDKEGQTMDRVTELLAANSRIVLKGRDLKRMLEKARDQFAFYADNHRAKNTKDGDKKAETNDRMVAEIQKTLDEYHVIEAENTVTV